MSKEIHPREESVSERSIAQLFADLSEKVSLLVQQEVRLAVTEFEEKLKRAAKDATLLIVGAVILYAALWVLLATLILGLAVFMPAWVAALIVGAGITLLGGILFLIGWKDLANLKATPEKTIKSLEQDARMLKEQT